MTRGHWILDEKGERPIPADLMTWAKWFEKAENRVVKKEQVGECSVSTVFLGLDHNFEGGAPILWETMVFGGCLDHEMDRCTGNREQAEAMHRKIVERVRGLA